MPTSKIALQLVMVNLRARSGFTLVETLLVLIIIALVIGAIWTGYGATVRYSNNVQQEKQIGDLLQMTRDYLQRYNENDPIAYDQAVGQTKYITADLIAANLLPSSVGITSGAIIGVAGNVIMTQYGLATINTSTSATNPYGTGPLFGINLYNFGRANCIDTVNAWAGSPDRVSKSGLVSVTNAASQAIATNNLLDNVVTSKAITTFCDPTNSSLIRFYFRLNP